MFIHASLSSIFYWKFPNGMNHRLTLIALAFVGLVLTGQGCVSLSGNKGTGTSGPAGVFVSEDQGETWKQSSQLPTVEGVKTLSQVSVYRLTNDPNDSKAFYWLSRANGLLYTYDNGKSWRTVEGKLKTGFIRAVAVHPKDPCTLVASTGTEVYRSDDCSRSWKEIYRESRPNVPINSLAFNPFEVYEIFIGEGNGDLLKSADQGVSWSVVNRFRNGISQVELDPNEEGILYVATRKLGLFKSDDGGTTWASLKETMEDFPNADEFRRFALHPTQSHILYWISTYGILISEDEGTTWSPIELITPPGSAQIYGFAVNPNNEEELYYTATINSRSTFYKSIDGGKRWVTKRLPSGQLPTALRVHPDDGNIIYIGFTIPPSQ